MHAGSHLQENGRLNKSLTNIRYALVVPRMQVQELYDPRLPNSPILIKIDCGKRGGGGLIWNLMETDTSAQYAPVEGGGERKSYPLLTFHTNNTGGVDAFSHNVSHT